MTHPALVRLAVAAAAASVLGACGQPVPVADVVIVVAGGDCTGENQCDFDFGAVGVGAAPATHDFTIKNNGEVATDLSGVVTAGDPAFTVQAKGGLIDAHGTAHAVVSFAPTAAASAIGALVVTWDEGRSKTSVELTGKGN